MTIIRFTLTNPDLDALHSFALENGFTIIKKPAAKYFTMFITSELPARLGSYKAGLTIKNQDGTLVPHISR
jgi:hypothetical protein